MDEDVFRPVAKDNTAAAQDTAPRAAADDEDNDDEIGPMPPAPSAGEKRKAEGEADDDEDEDKADAEDEEAERLPISHEIVLKDHNKVCPALRPSQHCMLTLDLLCGRCRSIWSSPCIWIPRLRHQVMGLWRNGSPYEALQIVRSEWKQCRSRPRLQCRRTASPRRIRHNAGKGLQPRR